MRWPYHKLKSTLQIVDTGPAPSLPAILRSQQQGETLALLGDPDRELSLTEVSQLTGAPHSSAYREIQRAQDAGLPRR